MADPSHASAPLRQPPPAPPLPPGRAGGVFQKIIAPLSFNIGTRQHGNQGHQSAGVTSSTAANRIYRHLPSQTTGHRTGIPIAAVDINRAKTHAILAGQDILKTVHVQDGRMVEDFNLRSAILSSTSASAYGARSENAYHRREYMPAKDVCWSKGDKYNTIVATAAQNGRISLYDVSRLNSSRIELAWIHEHTGQVNKLDFDPTGGYLLLSGSQDKTVRIWDIREPQSVKRKGNISIRQPVRDVRWSPTDVGEFALCTENGVVQRWDLRNPSTALLSINHAHEKACYAIDWHPDGRHLVSGGFDKFVRVWDLKSDNKRQRPAHEVRAPQAILNVRWRPPCWSTDPTEKGHWQSAQLATSYTDDDPRIHIWDLRRRHLPFKELDRYNTRPTDLLWASQDFLWSVGNQGMFVQNDVRYASLVHDELPLSASGFMPDSSFVAFSEDTRKQRKSSLEDPATTFLRIPREKLSGGTDGQISRSLSDDDDGEDGLLTTAVRRRVSKSSRSAKSQGNTPPTGDGFTHIVPLDVSILNGSGVFINKQLGVASNITGVSAEPEVVEFLAENYALPMTVEERRQNPSLILERLHRAFVRNANACDYVSMHRMAQSWRILGAVIIPELKDWADVNRRERLEAEARRRISSKSTKGVPPALKLSRAKVINNLFRGITEAELHGSDIESTSNMTTPTAKPLPDSPTSPGRNHGNTFLHLHEAIEPIPPLPPSVISAHSAAAAASKALLDTASDDSPASSPEKLRRPVPPSHRRAITDIPVTSFDRSVQLQSPKPQPVPKPSSSPLNHSSPRTELRKQEDRRAALRDFRAQQRQPFTLEEPTQSPRYSTNQRHDSSESFPMFSASTDSSHRARSLGQSFDLPKDRQRGRRDSEEWQSIRVEDAIESPLPSNSSENSRPQIRSSQSRDSEDGSMQGDFPMDETSRLDFGSDGAIESKQNPTKPKPSTAASIWDIEDLRQAGQLSQSGTAASSASGEVFPFEEALITQKPRIYISNPIRRIVSKAAANLAEPMNISHLLDGSEIADSKEYVYGDFRPIDFTIYEPKLPFAWSALPLLCHSIAFDISEGIANAQFSVHLLIHLHPFFFDPGAEVKVQPGIIAPDNTAERLMRPDLSHRIIEGLFLNHYLYLKKIGLYRSMSELRNICMDFGFNDIFQSKGPDQSVGSSLKQDPFRMQASCSHCYSFLHSGAILCHTCGRPRPSCPICLQVNATQEVDNINHHKQAHKPRSLWIFCQACGHSGHWNCMQEWMSQANAEGECPTRGCGCDCGPGLLRQQRIAHQLTEADTTEMIRGGRNPTAARRDPVRASHSPAVDKTRDALRNSEMTRDSSGDERIRRSFSGRGASRGGISSSVGGGASRGPSQSLGRRVRLVTPGEESGPSFSAS